MKDVAIGIVRIALAIRAAWAWTVTAGFIALVFMTALMILSALLT